MNFSYHLFRRPFLRLPRKTARVNTAFCSINLTEIFTEIFNMFILFILWISIYFGFNLKVKLFVEVLLLSTWAINDVTCKNDIRRRIQSLNTVTSVFTDTVLIIFMADFDIASDSLLRRSWTFIWTKLESLVRELGKCISGFISSKRNELIW